MLTKGNMSLSSNAPPLCLGKNSRNVLGEAAPAFAAAVEIVVAYLQTTSCSQEQVGSLLRTIHGVALGAIRREQEAWRGGRPHYETMDENLDAPTEALPIVSIEDSVTDSYLICLEDGKKVKSLKQYLRTRYSMTAEQYKRKWKLPDSYPFVASALSRKRSLTAKQVKPHLFRQVSDQIDA